MTQAPLPLCAGEVAEYSSPILPRLIARFLLEAARALVILSTFGGGSLWLYLATSPGS